jgi:dTMP kinase
MFITFEGIDGCGKTTQLNLLKEYLEQKGKSVLTIREPGGTAFSEHIRDLLLHSEYRLNSLSELMLFEAARADLTEQVINPALKVGKFVLSDRFFDSTTAYQGYGRKLNLDMINRINLFATGGLEPNLTFYLRIGLETSLERTKSRYPDKIEKSGNEFYKRLLRGFDEIANKLPGRFFVIDSERDIDIIQSEIRQIIDENCLI